MNLSGNRTRSLFVAGLVGALSLAGGALVGSQKRKQFSADCKREKLLFSMAHDICEIGSNIDDDSDEESVKALARQAVYKRATDFDDEYELMCVLGLM